MDPINPQNPQDPANSQPSTPPTSAPGTLVPPPVWASPAGAPPATSAPQAPGPGVTPPVAGWGPAPVMPGPVTTAAPKLKRRRDPLSIVLVIAAFVALGGVGFAIGRVTAPATAATNARGALGAGNGNFAFPSGAVPGNGGNGGLGRGFGGAVAIRGTVTAVTDTEVTVKTAAGGTVTIPLSSTTAYHNETAGSASDVKTGSTVLVQLGQGTGGPNASPGASPGTQGGRGIGTAEDITIVAQ